MVAGVSLVARVTNESMCCCCGECCTLRRGGLSSGSFCCLRSAVLQFPYIIPDTERVDWLQDTVYRYFFKDGVVASAESSGIPCRVSDTCNSSKLKLNHSKLANSVPQPAIPFIPLHHAPTPPRNHKHTRDCEKIEQI